MTFNMISRRIVPACCVCLGVALFVSGSWVRAGVNWDGVAVDPNTPLVFEDPDNWDAPDYMTVLAAGPELTPPGPDSTWFLEDYHGSVLMTVPRDGSNTGANAKIGALAIGGGAGSEVSTLIIDTDVVITGVEREADEMSPNYGEIRASEGIVDTREIRVGRGDTTPFTAGGEGSELFPWGVVRQTSGTVTLEYADGPGDAHIKIAGDKDSSAGGLWEVGGTASLVLPVDSTGVSLGNKVIVSPGAIFRVRGSSVGQVNAGGSLRVDGFASAWDIQDTEPFTGANGSFFLGRQDRGKSILEFVLDGGGVTPMETDGTLRIGSQVVDGGTLSTTVLFGFMRVKLSEPTSAGLGADEVVLVRSESISSGISVIGATSQTQQGIFYDPDRLVTSGSLTTYRGIARDTDPTNEQDDFAQVISDYAGVTYTWDVIYTDGTAASGVIEDAIKLTNLTITGGIEGDFDDANGLDVNDIQALLDARGSISLVDSIDSAQNMFDLDADGLITDADVAEWVTHPGFANTRFGDVDLDGDVDGDDRAAIESGFGMSAGAGWADGDTNGDGAVNGRDVFTWLRNFTGPGAVAAAQVPEPASLLLLTLAAALLPRRMR